MAKAIWLMLGLVAAGACGSADGGAAGGGPAAPGAPANVPVPGPLSVGPQANGQAVRLVRGQHLVIELPGVPTAGYVWQMRGTPACLRLVSESARPQNPEAARQGMVGGSSFLRFEFAPTAPGPCSLILDYGRPWEIEAGSPPTDTFRLDVAPTLP
jgi:predicted secreted protein